MKLQFKSILVELGQKQYNVLSLSQQIKVYVCKSDRGYLTIYGDTIGLDVLAYCFAYAALNPDLILFLSFRQHGLTAYLEECEGDQAARDLVILHHRLQLNYKDWKSIRTSLQRNKTTDFFADIEEHMPERLDTKPFRSSSYHENKDILNIRDYLHTIFLIGSREVFGSIANDYKSLSSRNPNRFLDEYPGYHDHKHLDWYMGNQSVPFSVDFYDELLWGR